MREMLMIKPEFLEKEQIIPKLQYLEWLEARWPYPQSQGESCYKRIMRALKQIPSKYQQFALALFANVIYLPSSLLRDTWAYLLRKAARKLGSSETEIVENAMLYEVDTSGLVYDFINRNRIEGRLDIDRLPRIDTIDQLIDKMLWIVASTGEVEGLKIDIKTVIGKQFWLLLVDNSLSGTSLCSELEKTLKILTLMKTKFQVPKVIPLIQVITEDAEAKVGELIKANGNIIKFPIYAFRLDSRFKIDPENASHCRLFYDQETLEGVIELCKWFATETPFASDPTLKQTKEQSGDNLAFGFKAGGLTLVTPNCPTNSLPLLWYSNPEFYTGPFIRIRSRLSQKKGYGKERLRELLNYGSELLDKLV
jgi:hypothetical protein